MKKPLHRMILAAAAAAVAAGLAAGPAMADDLKDWQRDIAMAVAKKQVYPRSALRQEVEGHAKVRVTVDRNGAIAAFEIVEETGHAVLDREVPKLIERVNPLPAPPASAGEEHLTFLLPLAWVLQ